MEEILDTHICLVDRKDEHGKLPDGKIRLRFSNRNAVQMSGDTGFTIRLTDKERLKLIHMLSE